MEAGLHLFLKAEIKRVDISYEELAERLEDYGLNESAMLLANKLVRRTFAATRFLASLAALELKSIRLEDI